MGVSVLGSLRVGGVVDKRRLIALLGVLLIGGFLATSLLGYFVARRSMHQSIVATELPLTSDNIYSEIQHDLLRPIFVSSMMANDTFLRDWVLAGEKDATQITRYLNEIKTRYGAFTSFFISERTRNYYHANGILKTVREDEPRDVWYFRVRQLTEPYEINVDPDMAHQDAMTIFINYRVFGYDQQYIGVAGVGLTVSAMRQLINNYQQKYGRIVYFVDKAGNIVFSGNDSGVTEESLMHREGMKEIATQVLSAKRGDYQYEYKGHTHLSNVRFIPDLNWYLVVEKVEDEALTGIRQTLYTNLAISLLVSLLILAAATYTVNSFQRRLELMATTDKLTGLANRQAYDLLMAQAMKDTQRTGEALSLALFDIDNFKTVNDRFGHLAGDHVITTVGELAKSSLRASDIVCRWGGEEYIVLLSKCSESDALHLAEKMRVTIAQATITHEDKAIQTTASFGIAQYRPGDTHDTLLSRADHALYAAKDAGRNRVVVG
ncbi:MAG: GGDEF domain-containing protein [Alphaproteobacteria bacterium]|nr:GGDEF domain-containing protein [Alphaproteobacteria bacterium]